MINHPHPSFVTAALAAAGPLLLVAFGLLPAAWLDRRGVLAARAGAAAALVALGLALASAVRLAVVGPAEVPLASAGRFHFGVYLDNLSALALILVSFLLAVVARYSVHYLAGDPAQGRFMKWLCLTGASVLTVLLADNLVQFALAWSATSWSLHQLLLFYPDRTGAVLAARKKFIISRAGDACLLAVIGLVHARFHTWDFSALFAAAGKLADAGLPANDSAISAIGFLLVAGAMLKSAQFPFHSWLPDTMETPTPVSALMHAGIINAGGYLIIRLHPLVTLSPAALTALAVFGAFTGLFASLVMLTHASVKRALAFSTVAQMGFMMLECGLGAFSLAMLHLIAHSLYKAHAFLASGSTVKLARSAWVPVGRPRAHPLTLLAAFGLAALLLTAGARILGADFHHEAGLPVLGCVLAMALGYGLWNLWAASLSLPLAAAGTVLSGGILGAYFGLHRLFEHLLGVNVWENSQLGSWPGTALLVALLALFFLVLTVQTELPEWSQRPLFQRIYVHARNGFYFNTLANRAVTALWPVSRANAKP